MYRYLMVGWADKALQQILSNIGSLTENINV